ncbi:MAG: lipoprotein [Acidobacteriia bacterium]|nr:lipoprotein [Terriglobia bacterium]
MKRLLVALVIVLALSACTRSQQSPAVPVELKHFALDDLSGVRATTGVAFDSQTSADGKGSLRIDATQPMTVPLFEVTDVNIENATLIYQSSLQSEKLDGQAFLEMWVRIPGKGEFFSRGLDRPITGTMSWMTVATPFFLQAGQKPDLIRLNLVVQGKGRVWIDDVHLMRAPLPNR